MIGIRDGVALQRIEGEIVLLDTDSGTYFGLDPIGSHMLGAMLRKRELDEVIDALLGHYETDEKTLRRDLQHLLEQLREHDLIVDRHELGAGGDSSSGRDSDRTGDAAERDAD